MLLLEVAITREMLLPLLDATAMNVGKGHVHNAVVQAVLQPFRSIIGKFKEDLIYIVVSKIADIDRHMQPALQALSDKMSPRFIKTLSPAFVASLSYYPFAQALRRYHPS